MGAHVMLKFVVGDDVGAARDADLAAEDVDGLGRNTAATETSKRQQPANTQIHERRCHA